jgi:hypothetical protein
MQIKHKLIAQIIKQWRSDSEERALAEAILYMTGLHLTELQKMSTEEVTNVLIEVIRRPEEKEEQQWKTRNQEEKDESPLGPQWGIETKEPGSEEPQPEEVIEEKEAQPLSFIEAKKLRRGRKPNV